ncbi:uncharacterized protein [Diadema antillarum]|uniref:uncharacterized protein n=1 Tax=Diadema antillarum TaxID=105358 RepID=UPI003A8BC8D7
MAKALFFVLAALLFVAALAEVEMDEQAELIDYFMAEKRGMGRNMRKYKYCQQWDQNCWCSRKSGKVVFCNGAASGDNI